MKLNTLLQNTGMWRASSLDYGERPGTPTGFRALDENLPGGGWPQDGVVELLHDTEGIGEFRLLLPALARLSNARSRWVLWVSPPYIPFAPALASAGIDLERVLVTCPRDRKDALWVLEKAFASGSCSAIVAWPFDINGFDIHDKEIRRLQVASKEGHTTGFLFRAARMANRASPAELRVQLERPRDHTSANSRLQMRILKRRGGWATDFFTVDFADRLGEITPDIPDMPVGYQAPDPGFLPAGQKNDKGLGNDFKLS